MTLVDFKNIVLSNNLPNDFIILKCADDTFIANQYIEAICNNTGSSKILFKAFMILLIMRYH